MIVHTLDELIRSIVQWIQCCGPRNGYTAAEPRYIYRGDAPVPNELKADVGRVWYRGCLLCI